MSNIEIITQFIAEQMDGEPVPPAGSSAFKQIHKSVGEILKHNSTRELELLAHHVLGEVINRVGANVKAQATLEKFIRGDYAG